MVSWREQASKQTGARITYTDLLVKNAVAGSAAAFIEANPIVSRTINVLMSVNEVDD